MNTLVFVIAVGIAVFALLLYAIRSRSDNAARKKRVQRTRATALAEERSNSRWRAVRIATGLMCCEQASKISGQIFLSRETPQLPLEGCSESNCRCKYIHLDDRRSGRDRRVELDDLSDYLPMNQTERRKLSSRRAADLAA